MEQCYRHFDHKERTLMYWWRKEKLSLREIARRLRRSHTSISRELGRNRWCGQSYFPRGAQILAVSRLQRQAETRSVKVAASSGVCAREIAHWLDAGINRWAPQATGRIAHRVPQGDLPIHLLYGSPLDRLSSPSSSGPISSDEGPQQSTAYK